MQRIAIKGPSHRDIRSRNILFFGLCLFLLGLVYSSAFHAHYLLHDDYNQLRKVLRAPEKSFFETDIRQGRFLNAYLTNWQVYRLLDSSDNGSRFRLMSLIPLAFVALGFRYAFVRSQEASLESWVLPLCLVLLLPFQIIPLWVALLGSTCALLLAVIAFIGFDKILGSAFPSRRRATLAFMVAFLCEFLALNFYEPFAMFFWTLPAFFILLESDYRNERVLWRFRLALYAGAGLSAMALRILVPKLVLPFLGISPAIRSEELISSFFELAGRLFWFIHDPLVRAVNFWNFPNLYVTGFVLAVVIFGALLAFLKGIPKGEVFSLRSRGALVEKYLIVFAFLLLAYAPNLVVSSCEPRYRTFIAFTPILYLLFWQGCVACVRLVPQKWSRGIREVLLIVLLLAGVYSATKNTYSLVSINDLDRRVMDNQIKNMIGTESFKDVKQIHVLHFGARGKTVRDRLEFGYVSSAVDFSARGLAADALHRHGIEARRYLITASPGDECPVAGAGVAIIDMGLMQTLVDKCDM